MNIAIGENTHMNKVKLIQLRLALAAGALMLLSPGRLGAQPPPSTQASSPQASPTASPTPTAGPALGTAEVERVVVTAEKREQNIQDVPASISVINDTELDNLHANSLTDYAPYIPGFQVNSLGSPGQTFISLRGLADITSGATVATYIDETSMGSSGIYQRADVNELDLLPYDIRRVEILRGPQGTLYGANSIGGLIKYVTLDPSLTAEEFHIGGGISGVEHGDQPGWDTHIGGSVPLANGTVGLRLSYARNEGAGFIDNVVNGEHAINDFNQQAALVGLLWQPNDNVRLRFTALGQRIESDNNANVALDPKTLNTLFGDLTNEIFVNEPYTKNVGLIAATLNLNFGWADLTSATAYSNTRTDQRFDVTLGLGQLPLVLGFESPGISGEDINLNLDKFTQELRLTSKQGGRFLWQLGAFYTYEHGHQDQSIFLTQPNGQPFVGLPHLFTALLPNTYKEWAGFANASFDFTDRLNLGAGIRFSRNEQSFEQILSGLLAGGKTDLPGQSDENVFDYMVSPKFRLGKDQLLYARIATGYQPGGPNIAVPGVPPSVKSSTVTSYEGGLKSEFFDHRLLFDIAGYHISWEDIQVSEVVNGLGALVNAGKAETNGIELTTGFEPIKNLRFGINGAYTDATLSNNAPSLGGRAGDRLPNVPVYSASATIDYYFTLPFSHVILERQEQVSSYSQDRGKNVASTESKIVPGQRTESAGWNGHVGAGFRWVSSQWSEVESSPTAIRTPAYGAMDLNADLSNGRWTIRVYAKNVWDERAYPTVFLNFNFLDGSVVNAIGTPIQPRTVGVEVDCKF
jgi:outer membrane receptor protein involved in Fe transport